MRCSGGTMRRELPGRATKGAGEPTSFVLLLGSAVTGATGVVTSCRCFVMVGAILTTEDPPFGLHGIGRVDHADAIGTGALHARRATIGDVAIPSRPSRSLRRPIAVRRDTPQPAEAGWARQDGGTVPRAEFPRPVSCDHQHINMCRAGHASPFIALPNVETALRRARQRSRALRRGE
jgi:hypothetical protein